MGRRRLAATAFAVVLVTMLVTAGSAGAAPPAPCGGQPQITDATGDGHHINTDVTSAWYSEAAGRLQAVIQIRQAVWEPAHDDSVAAGFAFLFETGGQIRYVRAQAFRNAPVAYDYGTWTEGANFVSAGSTAGEVVAGAGGTVTIDVPAGTGAVPGGVLRNSFVLTYDGVTTAPHWVDRAPGGVTPAGTEYGADFVVGACGSGGGGNAVAAVRLKAPSKRVGTGRVRVRGSVVPARAGVTVDLTATGGGKSTRRVKTSANGSYSARIRLKQTTRIRAAAGGIRSQTLTVTMVSRTRIKIKNLKAGGAIIRGTTSPAVRGRVLLLRAGEIRSTAKTVARKGRFKFRLENPPRGRYQAVFIPSGGRAERSTSNKGVVR